MPNITILSGAGSASSISATTPGDITFGVVTQQLLPDGVRISIAYEPPSPLGDYLGFYPYLQSGDFLEDDIALGATLDPTGLGFILDLSTLTPPQSPEPLPYVPYDPLNKILSFTRPYPLATSTWIAYGVSRTRTVTNQLYTLDRTEPPPHSPSAVFVVRAKSDPLDIRLGAEVAPLALTFTLRAAPVGELEISGVTYYLQADKGYHWAVTFDWTNAVDDPRYPDLGGYDLILVPMLDPDTEGVHEVVSPGLSKDDLSATFERSTPPSYTVYRFYLVSWRTPDGAKNSIIYGTTPSIDVEVGRQPGAAGIELTSLVTGLTVTPRGYEYDGTGQVATYPLDISWTPPTDDPTYAGVVLHLIRGDLSDRAISGNEPGTSAVFDFFGFSSIPEDCIIYALSSIDDTGNNTNTYVPGLTPAVAFTVNPPSAGASGVEYAANVTPNVPFVTLGVPIPQADGTYIVAATVDATPPTDPKWGGFDIVVEDSLDSSRTTLLTNAPAFPVSFNYKPTATVRNVTFFVVSRSVNNKVNSIVPGTTPSATMSQGTGAGQLDFAKALGTSLATYFDVVAGALVIKDLGILTAKLADSAIVTSKLANLSVDTSKLAALAVDAAKLADSAVTATKIANLAVGSAAIAALAVGTAHIANASITDAKVASVSAIKITAGTLAAGVIYGGTVNANQINAGTLNAVSMNGGTLVLTFNGITTSIQNIYGGGSFPGSNQYIGIKVNDNATNRFAAMTPNNMGVTGSSFGGPPCATLYLKANGSGAFWAQSNTLQNRIDIDTDPGATYPLKLEGITGGLLCKVLIGYDYAYSINPAGASVWALGKASGGGILRMLNGSGFGGIDGIGSLIILNGATGILECSAIKIGGAFGLSGSIQVDTPSGTKYINVQAGQVMSVT